MENNNQDDLYQKEKKESLNMNLNTSELPTQKNSTLKKIQFYVTMVIGAIFLLLLLFSFFKNMINNEKEEKIVEVEAPKIQKLEKVNLFTNTKDNEKEIETSPFIVEEKEKANIFEATQLEKPPKPQIIKGATGTIIGSNNNSKSNGISSKYVEQIKDLEAQREALQNFENTGTNSNSNKDFDGDTFTPTVAKLNKFNPDLLLPKGSYIGCSLDTRFVSAIQGSTSCTVSQNIYSSNGNVLLIEKGSKLFGTYKGDNANDGTSRYFVVWKEVRTPNHLRIPLNSGSSDELGGAGLEGEIDHKWMMRFGSSIMLSMVDDIFNVLAYKMTNKNGGSNSGNQIDYTENTRDNASNIASIALEKFINIKPTVYKQHGDLVGVYVNRDVDFSQVYKITKKR